MTLTLESLRVVKEPTNKEKSSWQIFFLHMTFKPDSIVNTQKYDR